MLRNVPLCMRACSRRTILKTSIVQFAIEPLAVKRGYHSKEYLERQKLLEEMQSPYRIIRWGAIARSREFKKGLTKYLIGLYAIFLAFGVNRMNKLYSKEQEIEALKEKKSNGDLNDFETVKLKSLTEPTKMRTRDITKLQKYHDLIEQNTGREFNGNEFASDKFDEIAHNPHIQPARDTTAFYDDKAEDYDADVNFEEKMIFMGRRRKWLMRHCRGDVLEVSCGTGRNIKYLNAEKINSITYIDGSQKMIEIARNKFHEYFPNFKKVAFVCGRAEDLNALNKDKGREMLYDTIVETFGLCSHTDPVEALNNFSKLLKPGGRIVLLEHGRGSYDFINKILDTKAERRLHTWGCRWNLDIGELLDDSDLDIVLEKRVHLGTTWCVVAKKKNDTPHAEEITFVDKYIRSGLKTKVEGMDKK
ncbi:hypothetical protein TPHA_0E01150 [Tetrapisispora phaffii CBS 4417]|uniref:Methyltransferase type 12 domain-containing protein n=1 Tax=Tetrapisispora phaffii (strain ATCC 24235 / CBS 4417 / NBRC 1672 / NRRL Y-8282 / UCD 70-5) TaxID=1071381 RepID=G8BTI1_TETPH|nr:hypothetical protein TPHA_0E01150 [Tetrapisispora phaffii CBS 4417]CCE63209.1 hypothetical protein TPHA_0E01150 [Tetrapisispora phaffii CBS 4417]